MNMASILQVIESQKITVFMFLGHNHGSKGKIGNNHRLNGVKGREIIFFPIFRLDLAI